MTVCYMLSVINDLETGMTKPKPKPTVRVKPHSYQPSKAELEEPIKIDATPEQLARAVLQPVKVVEDESA